MKGSNLSRLGRVIAHLASHPCQILPYLRSGPLSKKTPLELGVPWFSQSAIDFLESYVKPSMRVFEYGSGGSTIFFARRAKSVDSIEKGLTALPQAGLGE